MEPAAIPFLATDGSDFHRRPDGVAFREACPICGFTGDGWPHRKHPVAGWESAQEIGDCLIIVWVPPAVVSMAAPSDTEVASENGDPTY